MPRIANSFPLKLHLKWFERYASLNKKVVTTYELEVDQAEASYLGAKLELQTLAKENRIHAHANRERRHPIRSLAYRLFGASGT